MQNTIIELEINLKDECSVTVKMKASSNEGWIYTEKIKYIVWHLIGRNVSFSFIYNGVPATNGTVQ